MNYRAFTATLILALCVLSVQAQSGRRQVKPVPAAPVPTPTPEPTPAPKKTEKESELLFFVGADQGETYAMLPLSYFDAALRGCVDRLRAGSSASVDVTDRSMNRGEAIKKAKSETQAYVVLLSLTFDSMARSYDDLVLEFVVFEPTTAKVVVNGRSYLISRRAGPVVVGPPRGTTNSGIYREQLIRQAGEDAGDRILKALHLDVEVPKKP
ncbi:MAG TPA: hypothetical protein VF088_04720 [Pyrinomonadaceae bacterium]